MPAINVFESFTPVNNLTSNSTTAPASANMARVLDVRLQAVEVRERAGDVIGSANTYGELITLRNGAANASEGDRYFLNVNQTGTGTADDPQYPRGEYVQASDNSLILRVPFGSGEDAGQIIGSANTYGELITLRNSNAQASEGDRYFLNVDQIGTGTAENPQRLAGEYVQASDNSLILRMPFAKEPSVDQVFDEDSVNEVSSAALATVINNHHIPEKYGLVGDYDLANGGGTDNSPMLQALVNDCDANMIPYIHLPMQYQNYRINTPVLINEPGLHIKADCGPRYMRPKFKNGNVIVGTGNYAFKLGDTGPTVIGSDSRANMWSFEGLSFYPYNFAPYKSKTGIYIDRQTNGPDRGIIFDKVSGTSLYAVIHIAPARPLVTTALANMVVQNSCLSNNRYGVYSEAPVYGIRFVGNQAEHNNNGTGTDQYDGGAIHGDIGGGITIEDNMLEGQPNAVNLEPSGHSMRLSFKRNYIEKNTVNQSQYVVRLKTTQIYHNNHADIGPNFFSGPVPEDYVIIEGKGSWTLNMLDTYPITFKQWAGAIKSGSSIFNQEVRHFRLKGLDTVKFPEIYVEHGGVNDTSGGELTNVNSIVSAAGYTDGETVTLNSSILGGGYGATGTVTVVTGQVTAVAVVEAGYGYTDGESVDIGTGGATGTAQSTLPDWLHVKYDSGQKVKTPWGSALARDGKQPIPIPMAVLNGDLVVLNILMMAKDVTDTLYAQITTDTGAFILALGQSFAEEVSGGNWVVVCMPVIMPSDQTDIAFRYNQPAGTAKTMIAGVSARNYGQYVNDGTVVQDIEPVLPDVFL